MLKTVHSFDTQSHSTNAMSDTPAKKKENAEYHNIDVNFYLLGSPRWFSEQIVVNYGNTWLLYTMGYMFNSIYLNTSVYKHHLLSIPVIQMMQWLLYL